MIKAIQRKIEYASLIMFSFFIRLAALSNARLFAKRLADFAWDIIRIRRSVVLRNLSASFAGVKSPQELEAIGRATYRQFAMTMVELLFFPKLSAEDICEMVEFKNIDLLEIARKQGRGAVMVGAHFGNWELMGAAIAQRFPISFVVGQQENIPVDEMLNAYRRGKSVKIIPLKLALRNVLKCLKANEFVAILADQDAHENGAFVPFFGRPASTPKGPAMFALHARCPLIMGTIVRRSNGRFTVTFDVVPKPAPSGSEDSDIVNYTANINTILEGYVRTYPDHWLWMHRRWKTRLPIHL